MPRHQLSEIVYFFILVELFEEMKEKISENRKKRKKKFHFFYQKLTD